MRAGKILLLVCLAPALMSLASAPSAVQDKAAEEKYGEVLTEPTPQRASARARHLGEDCTGGGQAECLTNLCLKYRPGPQGGHVCSDFCESSLDCPDSWDCMTLIPGNLERVCLPPRQWGPALAVRRAQKTFHPRPVMPLTPGREDASSETEQQP
jgi:hypothetical protein